MRNDHLAVRRTGTEPDWLACACIVVVSSEPSAKNKPLGGMHRTFQAKYLALHTQKSEEDILRDFQRPRYFNPYEAVSYGLIDTDVGREGNL
eukprot:1158626-Pelagomonas_calceolata.AAC.1